MKHYYYPDTDLVYVDPSVKAQKISPGIVFDFDAAGLICGIDIDSMATCLLSESALAKDWLRPEEDEVWKDL